MTPKERAHQIINSIYIILFDSDTDKSEEITISILSIELSIQSVKEIKRAIKWNDIEPDNRYWDDVIEEIKKLQ